MTTQSQSTDETDGPQTDDSIMTDGVPVNASERVRAGPMDRWLRIRDERGDDGRDR